MRFQTYNTFADDAATLSNMMNRFFNTVGYEYSRSGGSNGVSNGTEANQPAETESRLPLDVWATPEAFQLTTYLPGVNPEDVEITFEGEELTIRGKLPPVSEGVDFIKRELYHGAFVRRLTFSVPVNADAIEAHFDNGLLTLSIPKAEAIKPKQIKIQAK